MSLNEHVEAKTNVNKVGRKYEKEFSVCVLYFRLVICELA